MKYFNNIENLDQLRSQYKQLLKKWHPDNPTGDTAIMQEINNEYEKLFKQLKNKYENNTEDKTNYNRKIISWSCF